ncbi:hypothetical protein F4679DRAFT_587551 [Xylaria curta]|nr:hypothetical protein F4679DRAFT_587551 [Xylaria curta]
MDYDELPLPGGQYNEFLTEEYIQEAYAECQLTQSDLFTPTHHVQQSWHLWEQSLQPYYQSPYPEEPLDTRSSSSSGAGFYFADQRPRTAQLPHELPQVSEQPVIALPVLKEKRKRSVTKPLEQNVPLTKAASPRRRKKAGSLATSSKYRQQPYRRTGRITPVAPRDEYQVDVIKDSAETQGQVKYLVKWQGWPKKKDWTWEPFDNLVSDGAKAEARQFHQMNPGKPADVRVFLQDIEARGEIEEE